MTKDNSRFGESKGVAKDAIIIRFLAIIFLISGFQVATQYFAYQFNYQPQLGAHFYHISSKIGYSKFERMEILYPAYVSLK